MIEDIGWWIIRTLVEIAVPSRVAYIPNLMQPHERGRKFKYLGGCDMTYLGNDKYLIL